VSHRRIRVRGGIGGWSQRRRTGDAESLEDSRGAGEEEEADTSAARPGARSGDPDWKPQDIVAYPLKNQWVGTCLKQDSLGGEWSHHRGRFIAHVR
jgi:hypothetical protein